MSQLSFTIRKATQSDLDEIKTLVDAHRNELGFILRPALAESIARNEAFVAVDGIGLIGFVDYRHRRDAQTTLYHIVVIPEWRRRGVGQILIEAVQAEAAEKGKRYILLKCPENLPANAFYQVSGFELITSKNGRHRKLNLWQFTLPNVMTSKAKELPSCDSK